MGAVEFTRGGDRLGGEQSPGGDDSVTTVGGARGRSANTLVRRSGKLAALALSSQ